MIGDLRSILFWLAVVLLFLWLLQRGCNARMERFREWRHERQEQREERREDRWRRGDGQDSDDHDRRHWRRNRDRDVSTMLEAEHHATKDIHVHLLPA